MTMNYHSTTYEQLNSNSAKKAAIITLEETPSAAAIATAASFKAYWSSYWVEDLCDRLKYQKVPFPCHQ